MAVNALEPPRISTFLRSELQNQVVDVAAEYIARAAHLAASKGDGRSGKSLLLRVRDALLR